MDEPANARPVDFDSELIRLHVKLRDAWDIRPGERVLDVGCGAGQTTREAARAAHPGRVLGVDVSAAAVERARADGLDNVTFEEADAQVHDFAPGSFDVAISRFGTMFFADPVAAFANIGRALRPGGRLVMLVWQARDRNEWAVTIREALAVTGGPAATGGPDAFSLADPSTVDGVLRAAGFADVQLADVDEPVYYGPDEAAALAWVRGFSTTAAALKHADPAAATLAVTRLRDAFAARVSDQGVWVGSRAWLVTARRA
ncbi:class I SAM-dependent methyltransferase [Dactylosporangium siamense]|uniref:Methyltransferase n=1 Tax=Dactylosporangium siamense TaxID=685454 RepID=A0A919PNM4_9ACTN|nr:class I SAM-dependent methyltransferase [Dactylosporangium siamense]GIG48075.1 methyltransferase [Dactylosporangium siamense]